MEHFQALGDRWILFSTLLSFLIWICLAENKSIEIKNSQTVVPIHVRGTTNPGRTGPNIRHKACVRAGPLMWCHSGATASDPIRLRWFLLTVLRLSNFYTVLLSPHVGTLCEKEDGGFMIYTSRCSSLCGSRLKTVRRWTEEHFTWKTNCVCK